VLSAEGKLLLAYAERLLSLSSEAQAALKGHAPHGGLKLGALESVAATRLPALLARYHREFPAVRLELVTGTTGALVDKVRREELEAAFVAEPFAAGGLNARHVFTEELVLIGAKDDARISGAADVAGRTLLAFTTGCAYRRRLEAWLGRANVGAGRVMEYGSYHAIVACAAAGGGIAIVPKSVLRITGVETQLAVHPLPARIARAKVMLVSRSGPLSGALGALRKILE
jgi:DNA-binding transcriptional LysR family regulator